MVNKMDIEAMAMEQFKKYQSDWTYPVNIRRSFMVDGLKGKCVSFQAAIKMTLFTGQCFGLMPVIGISENDASKLRFTTKSFRFFYAIVTLMFLFTLNVLCFLKTFKDTDSSLGSNTSLIFHMTTWIIGLLFLRMAMRWPQLCLRIATTEAADPNMDYGLIRRCNIACFSVLFLALCIRKIQESISKNGRATLQGIIFNFEINYFNAFTALASWRELRGRMEHSLSDVYGLTFAIDCHPKSNLYESFNTLGFPWIFNYVTYNHFYGVLVQFTNIQCTFNWNFGDVFVICMSLYLTSRLDQVNLRIIAVKGRYVPSSYWRTMREDYSRACNLVRSVDDVIGGVIFISFANNLFFICLQLLHSLAPLILLLAMAAIRIITSFGLLILTSNPNQQDQQDVLVRLFRPTFLPARTPGRCSWGTVLIRREGIKATPRCRLDTEPDERPFKGYEQAVYFAFSFVFLMVRSVAVSLVAARVHSASKAPAVALYDVNSLTYCVEIQRFLEQIHGDTVALSGLQFFNVKRGLVLAIAGTIVTYELVLMQFAGVSPTSTTPV